MKHARVINNTVVEIFDVPNGFSIEDCFHPDLVNHFYPCNGDVDFDWTYDTATGNFTKPVVVANVDVTSNTAVTSNTISDSLPVS